MSEHSRPPVRFLLVDDLEENLVALEAVLRRPGIELLKACSGRDALELLLRHDVALALLDVQMPEMDGFELAELMRGTERTRRVPIIFLTAGGADWRRQFRGYEAGAVDFIGKPIDPHMLKSKADVFYEMYRQRQEVERLLEESRRQSAALAEADRRKDEFLAMLAHELRNPLAPVRNATEILRLPTASHADLQTAREVIDRQVTHMARLVDDLLDVARISRGKMELRVERCDLAQIVRQTAEDYRPTFAAAGLDLAVDIPSQPLAVEGDATRLAQVVGNLLHNASKFTPSGGHVEVSVSSDTEAARALVAVSDSGAGMSREVLDRIFEPFSQADQSLARSSGGLGLGLALTRGLVALHGGSIDARSEGPGRGSTFTVRLPLGAASADAASETPSETAHGPAKLKVLLIEDNRDAARSMQLLLTLLGHRVEVAHDGAEGLTAARAMEPDVVISDLGLPGELDGFAVAAALRGDRSFDETYLVALSGYGQSEDREKAASSGFDRYIVKPANLKELKATLATASSRVSLRDGAGEL